MKTYYDLTKKERKKYLEEFKKTPVGKEFRTFDILLAIIGILILVLDEVCSYIFPEYSAVGNPLMITFGILFLIAILYELYVNINFTAWLKNKYDIKRW